MVCHLLDKHNMDINRDNDDLRNFMHDSQDNGSALCSATLHKNLAVVHELLKRGARVNSPDWSPVTYAVRMGGFFPVLEPLLRTGADVTRALKISVIERNIDAAKACLQFDADPILACIAGSYGAGGIQSEHNRGECGVFREPNGLKVQERREKDREGAGRRAGESGNDRIARECRHKIDHDGYFSCERLQQSNAHTR